MSGKKIGVPKLKDPNTADMREGRSRQTKKHLENSRLSWLSGRSELGFVSILVVVASILLFGSLNMHVVGESTPGPQFFPLALSLILYACALFIAMEVIRVPRYPDGESHAGAGNFSREMLAEFGDVEDERIRKRYAKFGGEWRTYSDWRTVGVIVVALVGFILLLEVLGWVISAALLFWAVAWSLGARNYLMDLGISLIFSSVIQLAFNAGLGLPLPAGIFEGVL